MKNHLLFLFVSILSINCYSQISFEKGYYINNSGQKFDCLIKNSDWKNNPDTFDYKISEESKIETGRLGLVKEFGIYGVSKYSREVVQIDRSSDKLINLSYDKNPSFNEEQLFLKILVEGKANLYLYENGSFRKYFYNIDNSKVEQLIYKKYKVSRDQVGSNNRFRQQLWNNLKCSTITINKVENLKYNKKELIKFFVQYNECINPDFRNYIEKHKKNHFNLTLRPRLSNSSLTIQNSSTNSSARNTDTDFGNKLGFGFGIEAEFILPFNKNKWAISIEPTYRSFKAEKTTDVNNLSGGKLISEVDYKFIEIPISLRHYFFISNNSKVFVNASYIFDIDSNSSLEYKRSDGSKLNSLDVKGRDNLALGIGYNLNNKYVLEIRYQTSREILDNYVFWTSDYKTLSIIFGYSIF
ncbi:porin family protein [Aquimarina intermedia]|uniref:Outer membrane protein with beta-barrel domain n=1 Tax=Aquimarina intermedia TaxID=350814 RepID=A0A5S5C3B7_9FLAO|nr:tRNA modification GTPase [Aquimarina intermedia]TYP72972.1 hypothetical protein BD809_106227 [Aquimarina intermedia]